MFTVRRQLAIGLRVMVCLACALVCVRAGAADDVRQTTVGISATIEQLVLPGTELEAVPLEDRDAPIVLRVIATFPHGTAFRYDLVYYGLDPGRFDLKDYLRRKDGTSTDDLPPLPVEIVSILSPGQVLPNALEARGSPRLGGYRLLLVVAGVSWVIGLLVILLVRRKRRRQEQIDSQRQLTLADRLRPIVERAVNGKLGDGQQAVLERLLLAYWRRRLHLQDMKPAAAIAQLREHEDAGRLLRQLEIWLHQPGTAESVDVAELLKPYQDLPADEPPAKPESAEIAS